MNYQQALTATISAFEVQREIEKHYLRFEDFTAEYGTREYYLGSDVLEWLGY